ncbi:unnamed protein product [Staurois parvus]|uniref:Uncharacterized protein n=1 Tax=Staurois parvus TaxID=386267 RepID=A0ABN9C0L7_9NEOB|nr:unnamed protein product [Staurois parvus]
MSHCWYHWEEYFLNIGVGGRKRSPLLVLVRGIVLHCWCW